LQDCEEFCYLGSTISQDGGCEKEVFIRIRKANTVFGRLGRIWASKKISLLAKVRLYESLVLSMLLYGAETWLMKQTSTKKLEAAHNLWLRKIANEKIKATHPTRKDVKHHLRKENEMDKSCGEIDTTEWKKKTWSLKN